MQVTSNRQMEYPIWYFRLKRFVMQACEELKVEYIQLKIIK